MVGIAVPTIRLSSMASSMAIIRASTTTRTLRCRGAGFSAGPGGASAFPSAAFIRSAMFPNSPVPLYTGPLLAARLVDYTRGR